MSYVVVGGMVKGSRKEERRQKCTRCSLSLFFWKSPFLLPHLSFTLSMFKYRQYSSVWVVLIGLHASMHVFFLFFSVLIFVVTRVPCMAYGSSQLKEKLSRAIYHSHFGTRTQSYIHTPAHTFTFRSCPQIITKREKVRERWTPNGMGEEVN